MMVDIFCGLMSGAASGPNVRKWTSHEVPANMGQFFVALDPDCFAPGMSGRLQVSTIVGTGKIIQLCVGVSHPTRIDSALRLTILLGLT